MRPQPAHHGPPHVAHLPPSLSLSLCACARVSTPSVSTPAFSPRATGRPKQRTPRSMGRDMIVPPQPGSPPPIGHASPRTRQQRPHKSMNTNQAGARGGRRDTEAPNRPTKAPTPKHANTKRRTRPARKHETQPPASKHAHNKPALPPPARTQERPHSNVWAQPNVSARREPWKSRRPARTKRKRPTRTRRTTHTTSAQTTRFAYGVRLRPQGEDSAREGRSQ